MQSCLAIDFGTSNSLAAAATAERCTEPLSLDPVNADPSILRSVLFSPQKQCWEFGASAIDSYYDLGGQGRIFRSLKKFLPDPLFSGTQVHGTFYSLEDLLGRLLGHIKAVSERELGHPIDKALIGHPALFSTDPLRHQKALQRLEKAARNAGFGTVWLCPEPLAAAHQFATSLSQRRTVLICDFGGGTSDFTIVRMGAQGFGPDDVLAIGGLSVAGDAFDGSIMEHVVAPHFGSKVVYRVPLGSNLMSLPKALVRKMCSPADLLVLAQKDYLEFFRQLETWSVGADDQRKLENLRLLLEERRGYQLFSCIEDSKKRLSEKLETELVYDDLGIHLKLPLARPQFMTFSQRLVQSIVAAMDETLKRAQLSYADIDIVCCTGGTARLTAIQDALGQRLGTQKLVQHMHFHAVVRGLAHRAVQLLRAPSEG